MADLKFGLKQFGKETPPKLKNFFRTILYLSGSWAILSILLTEIPAVIIAAIDHYILIGLTLMRFTISFFHLDFDETNNE